MYICCEKGTIRRYTEINLPFRFVGVSSEIHPPVLLLVQFNSIDDVEYIGGNSLSTPACTHRKGGRLMEACAFYGCYAGIKRVVQTRLVKVYDVSAYLFHLVMLFWYFAIVIRYYGTRFSYFYPRRLPVLTTNLIMLLLIDCHLVE